MIAIIPAAGKGTRMAAQTKGESKEMLLLGGRPVIDWVIKEAVQSQCDRIVVVSHPLKLDLNSHLAKSPHRVELMMQEKQNGLGCAVTMVSGHESVLVLLADTVILPTKKSYSLGAIGSWVLVENIPRERVGHYGIVAADPHSPNRITQIVEKPKPADAPSSFAVAARYCFSSSMRVSLQAIAVESLNRGEGLHRELGLTDLLNRALEKGEPFYARELGGSSRRFDCGSEAGFSSAQNWVRGQGASY